MTQAPSGDAPTRAVLVATASPPAGESSDAAALRQANAELDRRIFDLHSLLKAGEALYEHLEVDGTCNLLMAICRERLRLDRMAVLVLEDSGGRSELVVRAVSGLDLEPRSVRLPARNGILWTLLKSGDPFSVCDPTGAPRFANSWAEFELDALGARVFVPLVMGDRVIGVLSLGNRPDGSVPGAADHEFLRTLASQASVALNTAHLYERLDVERRKQARSFHQLEILFDVTRKLAEVSDLARMLSLVLLRAIGAVSAEKGSLMLVDEHTDELVVRVVEGLDDPDMQQQINDGSVACRRFRRGEGVAGRVWETRKPVRVNDSNSDHRFVGSTGSYVRALICMPLIVDDEVLGVLNITNPIDTDFDESDESILGALADQAAIAIARARLYEAAITDGLTGLRIRRFGMARLHEECKRARRYGTTLSVALCDIDFFKKVNDTYGHPAGDEVLRVVATTLAASIRQDIDIGARYGGEEFLIVMPETDLTGASHMAERLRGEVEAITTVHDEHPIRVTLSIGLAEFVAGETPKALVARADRALYQAKEGGRNTVVLGRAQAPPDLAADAGDLPPVHTDGGSAAVPPIITAKKLGRARADDRKEPQP